MKMQQEKAQTIGLQALAWLVAQDDLLPNFLSLTGMNGIDLKQYAQENFFLAGVLDFILTHDAWIMAFCTVAGLSYDVPLAAKMALMGESDIYWQG